MSESTQAADRGRRKTLIGIVVSTKMDKTAVVSVEDRKPHALYRKIIRTTKRYKAHDPNNSAVLGDVVRIEESKPISKEKRWRIVQTMTRGNVAELAPRDIGVPEEALEQKQAPVVAAAEPEAKEETPVTAAPESEEPVAEVESEVPVTEAEAEEKSESSEEEARA